MTEINLNSSSAAKEESVRSLPHPKKDELLVWHRANGKACVVKKKDFDPNKMTADLQTVAILCEKANTVIKGIANDCENWNRLHKDKLIPDVTIQKLQSLEMEAFELDSVIEQLKKANSDNDDKEFKKILEQIPPIQFLRSSTLQITLANIYENADDEVQDKITTKIQEVENKPELYMSFVKTASPNSLATMKMSTGHSLLYHAIEKGWATVIGLLLSRMRPEDIAMETEALLLGAKKTDLFDKAYTKTLLERKAKSKDDEKTKELPSTVSKPSFTDDKEAWMKWVMSCKKEDLAKPDGSNPSPLTHALNNGWAEVAAAIIEKIPPRILHQDFEGMPIALQSNILDPKAKQTLMMKING